MISSAIRNLAPTLPDCSPQHCVEQSTKNTMMMKMITNTTAIVTPQLESHLLRQVGSWNGI